jgi:hypothetical protein
VTNTLLAFVKKSTNNYNYASAARPRRPICLPCIRIVRHVHAPCTWPVARRPCVASRSSLMLVSSLTAASHSSQLRLSAVRRCQKAAQFGRLEVLQAAVLPRVGALRCCLEDLRAVCSGRLEVEITMTTH